MPKQLVSAPTLAEGSHQGSLVKCRSAIGRGRAADLRRLASSRGPKRGRRGRPPSDWRRSSQTTRALEQIPTPHRDPSPSLPRSTPTTALTSPIRSVAPLQRPPPSPRASANGQPADQTAMRLLCQEVYLAENALHRYARRDRRSSHVSGIPQRAARRCLLGFNGHLATSPYRDAQRHTRSQLLSLLSPCA